MTTDYNRTTFEGVSLKMNRWNIKKKEENVILLIDALYSIFSSVSLSRKWDAESGVN